MIRRMNEAFNAGDYETSAAAIAPGAQLADHLPLPDVAAQMRGPGEVRAVMEAWGQGFTGFRADIDEYVDLGDFVVVATTWTFVSAGEGIETEWRGAEAYEVRDGMVVWGELGFRDRESAIEAARARARSGS